MEKFYISVTEHSGDSPATADEMAPNIFPFEKLPICHDGGTIQHDQMWSDTVWGPLQTGRPKQSVCGVALSI